MLQRNARKHSAAACCRTLAFRRQLAWALCRDSWFGFCLACPAPQSFCQKKTAHRAANQGHGGATLHQKPLRGKTDMMGSCFVGSLNSETKEQERRGHTLLSFFCCLDALAPKDCDARTKFDEDLSVGQIRWPQVHRQCLQTPFYFELFVTVAVRLHRAKSYLLNRCLVMECLFQGRSIF